MIPELDTHPNVWRVAAATVAVMAIGTVARLARTHWLAPDVASSRRESLKSWWVVVLAILGAAVLGRGFAVALFAVTSLAALHEFRVLRRGFAGPSAVAKLSYGLVPASYLWIWLGWPGVFIAFLPVAGLITLGGGMLRWAPLPGFSSAAGQAYWGLLLSAYAPAYAVLPLALPPQSNPVAGGAGWFLFLMLLTEFDDIAQALVGRSIGRRKIAPVVSPHKTWAGFVGGVLLTSLLAGLLGRWLTPWQPAVAMLAGLLISLAGFLGDLNISGIKRDRGVKDSSNLLPGQGGVLDRIDSLTFAAPAFYGFIGIANASGFGGIS